MVDMRVAEYHALYGSRVERKGLLIHFFRFLAALKLSAVQ